MLSGVDSIEVPFTALSDNMIVTSFNIVLSKNLFIEDLEPIIGELSNILNINIDFEYNISNPETSTIQTNYTIILCCIVIILIILINISMFYKFIIMKRTRSLSINKLCGRTNAKAYINI